MLLHTRKVDKRHLRIFVPLQQPLSVSSSVVDHLGESISGRQKVRATSAISPVGY